MLPRLHWRDISISKVIYRIRKKHKTYPWVVTAWAKITAWLAKKNCNRKFALFFSFSAGGTNSWLPSPASSGNSKSNPRIRFTMVPKSSLVWHLYANVPARKWHMMSNDSAERGVWIEHESLARAIRTPSPSVRSPSHSKPKSRGFASCPVLWIATLLFSTQTDSPRLFVFFPMV